MAKQAKEYTVGELDSIPPGAHMVVKVEKREIGIFNVAGTLYALPNLCPHQVGPLCQGKVSGTLIANRGTDWKPRWAHDGEIVTCPWHGLEYHVPTGQCLAFPEIRLRSYDVWAEGNLIKLRI